MAHEEVGAAARQLLQTALDNLGPGRLLRVRVGVRVRVRVKGER